MKYNHQSVEKKWQDLWETQKTFQVDNETPSTSPLSGGELRPKYYVLDMFPYPSGAGLHVGHPEGYTATDIISRYKRMNGFDVLHPMGWDAFGLPAENYAIKTGTHPSITTEENIQNFTRQIKSLGFSYDWDREINTTDPEYYKWTQWIFLQLYHSYFDAETQKAKPISQLQEQFEKDGTFDGKTEKERQEILAEYRLAYETEMPINFCPSCKTGLANEEVNDGACDRCQSQVERKNLRQWVLRITKYAERLIDDLDMGEENSDTQKKARHTSHKGGHSIGDSSSLCQFTSILEKLPKSVKLKHLRRKKLKDFYGILSLGNKEIILDGEALNTHFWKKGKQQYYFRKKWFFTIFRALQKAYWEKEDIAYVCIKQQIFRIVFKKLQKNSFVIKTYYLCQKLTEEYQNHFTQDKGDELKISVPIKKEPQQNLDWPEKIKAMQKNWIGKSEGAEVMFETEMIRGVEYFDLTHGGHTSVYHLTFNTEKEVEIDEEMAERLKKIFCKIARENNFYIAKGAIMLDHVHLVVSDPEEREMGELMKVIKGISSRRIQQITPYLSTGLSVTRGEQSHPYKKLWRTGYHFEPIKSADELTRVVAYVEQNPEKENLDPKTRVFEDREIITVYTTRPDTLFGATYMVLAPEHPLVEQVTTSEKKSDVETYVKNAQNKSDLERTELQKEKTGVFTGAYAINPVNSEKVPIWIADYVLSTYGTGAIMAVPGHDERDFEFAKKYEIEIKKVVEKNIVGHRNLPKGSDIPAKNMFAELPYIDKGRAINSDFLDGFSTSEAKQKMIEWLEENEKGRRQTNYKLRDWIFSRQRYWGEPIPVIHCKTCGTHAMDESQLPLTLPQVEKYEPSGTGESPLANITEWVETSCPKCEGKAKRETNTMPQWAGSSWYYLRFMDAQNTESFCSKEAEKAWGPVDLYVGGAEHAVLHLLYARFWHKVLFDLGHVSSCEPFTKLMNQGLILAEDGVKMSKSLGNVVNPDDIVEKYGADTLRMYEMFMGPFEQNKAWNTGAVEGMYKFLQKIWRLYNEKEIACCGDGRCANVPEDFKRLTHKTIKKVTGDIEDFKFNTAISQMMIWVNAAQKLETIPRGSAKKFCKLIAPFAPHLAEEIWSEVLGNPETISYEPWPEWDENMAKDDEIELAIQVNGKLRATLNCSADIEKEDALTQARELENVQKFLEGKEIVKEIFVPGKIVNLVVKG